MAQSVDNTKVYKEDWVAQLQARLSEPNKWKDICRVEYTNQRLLHNPYLTDPTVQTYTRGCAYVFQVITENDDNVTFNTEALLPQFVDRADLAQSGFDRQMEIADRQGVLIDEAIETGLYKSFAGFSSFDNATIGGTAGSITVSTTNVDDVISSVLKQINIAKGQSMLERNGGFLVWKPADFQKLQQFAQANGFQTADNVLRNGIGQGFHYMGFDHYTSNLLAAGRMIGGVKKVIHLGILKDLYGQIMVNEKDPGEMSGVSVVSRVVYGVKTWNKVQSLVFDIAVV